MGKTRDLGQRIELLPTDKHCHDISLGLYQRDVDGVPQFLVHTYSPVEAAAGRIAFLNRALIVMAGLQQVPGEDGWLRFPCKTNHERALKRGFLDLCRLPNDALIEPKPLTVFDKKADCNLTAAGLGEGVYQIEAEAATATGPKRAAATARGFAKLCQMDTAEGHDRRVTFPCKTSHDVLIGLLLFRAQNVRSAMQEEEQASARGVLSAPSQQM